MRNADKIMMGAALASVLMSAGIFWWRGTETLRDRRTAESRSGESRTVYSHRFEEKGVHEPVDWRTPVAQSRGEDWLYDLFTPPEIFYDSGKREFSVRSVEEHPKTAEGDADAGIRVVAIRRVPFPLQLLGYFRRDGRLIGSFERTETHDVFLAEAGHVMETMGLVIEGIQTRPQTFVHGGESATPEGSAQVRHVSTGKVTTLACGERSFTEAFVAIVAVTTEDGEEYLDLRLGDEVGDAKRRYAIDRIELDPPRMRLVEIGGDSNLARRLELSPQTPGSTSVARSTD